MGARERSCGRFGETKMDRILGRSRLRTCMITGFAEREALFQHIAHALESGVDWVQLRSREASGRDLESFVSQLLARHPDARAKILVNDRFDLALAARLGGVHLPADGLPVADVRRSAPPELAIGRSTHSVAEVRDAAQNGADYVFFGPIYPTKSKPGHPGVGLERLAAASRAASIPVYALGGISPQRIDAVFAAGAAGVAAIALFQREASVRALFKKLA